MPRRHRSAREREPAQDSVERPRGIAPEWAQMEGATVRANSGERAKTYRCPGCHHEIRAGTPHLVVIIDGDPEGRRHWHTPCWGHELKQRRR